MQKIVLTYGLIAGAILSVLMLATIPFMDQIGFDKAMVIGYTTMVVAFLMVFFGIKSYRDNVAGGTVTFGRAFKVGILITLISSVCYMATWQVIYRKITPDFMEKYSAYAIEKERAAGGTEAEIEKTRAQMAEVAEMYKNPLVNIGFTLIEPLPVGLLFTLIAAGVFSRRRRELGATANT